MSVPAITPSDVPPAARTRSGLRPVRALWAVALALFVLAWLFAGPFAEWAFEYPKGRYR